MESQFINENQIKRKKKEKTLMQEVPKEGRSSESSSIKVRIETAEMIRKFLKRANGDGPRRVLLDDLLSLLETKITEEDLQRLRREKATVQDLYEERFRLFQTQDPTRTREMFLSELLRAAEGRAV